MIRKNAEVQQSLDRAAEFFKEFGPQMGNVPALARIEEARQKLSADGATRHGADKAAIAGTESKEKLRARLRSGHMLPIARIATAHAADIAVPKMAKFVVPQANASDVTLLEAAESMAKAAEEYFGVFRDEGLGEQFLAELVEATAAFKVAILERDNHRYVRTRSKNSADARAREARRTLRVAGAVVERKFADRPEIIAEWRSRVRIPQKPGVPRGKARQEPAVNPASAEGGALKIA